MPSPFLQYFSTCESLFGNVNTRSARGGACRVQQMQVSVFSVDGGSMDVPYAPTRLALPDTSCQLTPPIAGPYNDDDANA